MSERRKRQRSDSPPPAKAACHRAASASRDKQVQDEQEEEEDDVCVICLSELQNISAVQPCGHALFCFPCIFSWSEISRACPICKGPIELLLSSIQGPHDYQKHYLQPLASTSSSSSSTGQGSSSTGQRAYTEEGVRAQLNSRHTHPRHRHPQLWRSRQEARKRAHSENERLDEVDQAELSLLRRKHVYRHNLFAKHIGSNAYSRFRNFTPQQFAASSDLKSRATRFIRRELMVFPHVDAEFLLQYTTSIMAQLDLKSDGAIRLIEEFLGDFAPHFVHEVTSYMRSPFTDVRNYDRFVSYDRPKAVYEPAPPPPPQPPAGDVKGKGRQGGRRPRRGSYPTTEANGSQQRRRGPRTPPPHSEQQSRRGPRTPPPPHPHPRPPVEPHSTLQMIDLSQSVRVLPPSRDTDSAPLAPQPARELFPETSAGSSLLAYDKTHLSSQDHHDVSSAEKPKDTPPDAPKPRVFNIAGAARALLTKPEPSTSVTNTPGSTSLTPTPEGRQLTMKEKLAVRMAKEKEDAARRDAVQQRLASLRQESAQQAEESSGSREPRDDPGAQRRMQLLQRLLMARRREHDEGSAAAPAERLDDEQSTRSKDVEKEQLLRAQMLSRFKQRQQQQTS